VTRRLAGIESRSIPHCSMWSQSCGMRWTSPQASSFHLVFPNGKRIA